MLGLTDVRYIHLHQQKPAYTHQTTHTHTHARTHTHTHTHTHSLSLSLFKTPRHAHARNHSIKSPSKHPQKSCKSFIMITVNRTMWWLVVGKKNSHRNSCNTATLQGTGAGGGGGGGEGGCDAAKQATWSIR